MWIYDLSPTIQQYIGDVPPWLIFGWIDKESGGNIASAPAPLPGRADSERGYCQLDPDESAAMGIDHTRLSTDADYSVQGCFRVMQYYGNKITADLGIPYGSEFFWRLVKLAHGIGYAGMKTIVQTSGAQDWPTLETYVYAHPDVTSSHSAVKWVNAVDAVYNSGWNDALMAGMDPGGPVPDTTLTMVALAGVALVGVFGFFYWRNLKKKRKRLAA